MSNESIHLLESIYFLDFFPPNDVVMKKGLLTHIGKLDHRHCRLLVINVSLNKLHNLNRLHLTITLCQQLCADMVPVPCHHIFIHNLVELILQLQ